MGLTTVQRDCAQCAACDYCQCVIQLYVAITLKYQKPESEVLEISGIISFTSILLPAEVTFSVLVSFKVLVYDMFVLSVFVMLQQLPKS